MNYRGYNIERRYVTKRGKPQPNEFEFVHPDYDGPPDPRCGFGRTLEDCKRWIDELIEDEENEPPSLQEWMDAWESEYANGQTTISRHEAKRRYDRELERWHYENR